MNALHAIGTGGDAGGATEPRRPGQCSALAARGGILLTCSLPLDHSASFHQDPFLGVRWRPGSPAPGSYDLYLTAREASHLAEAIRYAQQESFEGAGRIDPALSSVQRKLGEKAGWE